ncbi:Hypothetical protein SMAX5B_011520 [Scophthalmus maximus]|uniref:Uncharacterized protein n=1 Tax=Scophthalmus maximus TaxID=52904 RepID=A0A2U9BNY3_SCOMX|nr:Hypothetical protein SMAX5B_011520 [Scophthalmus maximus]
MSYVHLSVKPGDTCSRRTEVEISGAARVASRGFETLGAERITCSEVLDHRTAYSHTPTSIWCDGHSSQSNDPRPLALNSKGQVINMSDLRRDSKPRRIAGGPLFFKACLTIDTV